MTAVRGAVVDHPVAIDARARRAWPWLPPTALVDAILLGPTAEVLRIREDGAVDEVLPGGLPRGGPASDPCNTRRAA